MCGTFNVANVQYDHCMPQPLPPTPESAFDAFWFPLFAEIVIPSLVGMSTVVLAVAALWVSWRAHKTAKDATDSEAKTRMFVARQEFAKRADAEVDLMFSRNKLVPFSTELIYSAADDQTALDVVAWWRDSVRAMESTTAAGSFEREEMSRGLSVRLNQSLFDWLRTGVFAPQ